MSIRYDAADKAFFDQVAALVRQRSEDFRDAGNWLDNVFSSEAIRQGEASRLRRERKQSGHRRIREGRAAGPGKPVNDMVRLTSAFVTLLRAWPPLEERSADDFEEPVARRIVLITWILTDKNAHLFEPCLTTLQTGKWEPIKDLDDSDPDSLESFLLDHDDKHLPHNRWLARRLLLSPGDERTQKWLEQVRTALAVIERSKSNGPGEVVHLPIRSWSAPVVLLNPADAYPTWPLYPFGKESEAIDFAMWSIPLDKRTRCVVKREHLASFRRWDLWAEAHGMNWPWWRAHLASKCGLRHSELAGLSVPDICDVLDHAEIPREHSIIADALRSIGRALLQFNATPAKSRFPNDTKYVTCVAADLLAKGHDIPYSLQTIGVVGLANGIDYFYKALAKWANTKASGKSISAWAKMLERAADQLALPESKDASMLSMQYLSAIVKGIRDVRQMWRNGTEDGLNAASRIGGLLLKALDAGADKCDMAFAEDIRHSVDRRRVAKDGASQNPDLPGEWHAFVRAVYLLMKKSGKFTFGEHEETYLERGVDALLSWLDEAPPEGKSLPVPLDPIQSMKSPSARMTRDDVEFILDEEWRHMKRNPAAYCNVVQGKRGSYFIDLAVLADPRAIKRFLARFPEAGDALKKGDEASGSRKKQ